VVQTPPPNFHDFLSTRYARPGALPRFEAQDWARNDKAHDATTQMAKMTGNPVGEVADVPSPWWTPARHADVRPFLAARSAVTRAVRAWFDEQGFVEVETGILQVSPGNETHLHAPRTELAAADGKRATRYLRTSPEFACKKLLAAGEQKIFEFARVFRDRERGDLHLPEFTMLEWYRANASYDAVMADSVVVTAHAAQATGIGRFSFRGRIADPFAEPELLTVAAAFERFAGIDVLGTVADGKGDRAGLAAAAKARVRITDDDTWSDIFSKVLVEHVEPNLGQGRLTVLFEYPVPEAALARAKQSDPRVAERFEIYACGVELANGFGELTDAREQRHRFTQAMDEKQRRYGERYPLDEDFLGAVAQMPQASGVALGFDRLVMLASGALRIDQVVWTPPAGDV
jgi:lysyl-tRNA synthetase class 2